MESRILSAEDVVNQAIYIRNNIKGSKLCFLSDYIPIGHDLLENGRAMLTVPYCESSLENIVWPAEYSDFTPQLYELEEDLNEFSNERRLCELILNFLKDFSVYQLDKIPSDSDARRYISHCVNNDVLSISDWQLLVNDPARLKCQVKKNAKAPLVRFYLKMPLDTSDIPGNIVNNLDADFDISFTVSFDSYYENDSEKIGRIQVNLPHYIKDILNKQNIKLESFNIEGNGLSQAICNYLWEIKAGILKIESSVSQREGFLAYLLSELSTQALEFDSLAFRSALFLVELNDFYCVLEILLDDSFPLTPPTLYLRSIYDGGNDDNTSSRKTKINFSYSPNMSIHDTARKVMETLPIAISDFKSKR